MSKRVASPLSSEIDKKLKLGLTDEDVKLLNNIVGSVMKAPHYAQFNKEDVPTSALALAFQLVAIAMLSTRHAAIIDNSWVKNSAESNEQRITQLSPEEQSKLASIWVEARDTGEWERFVDIPLIQVERPTVGTEKATNFPDSLGDQITATEKSWEHPFQGNAARGLWEHIETHYKRSDSKVYAHYAAVVQSSGMGKSRTVDELAKTHLVIPLNLRAEKFTGYPPADSSVRDYLTLSVSKAVAYNRASAFLQALFEHMAVTLRTFNESSYVEFANEFRSRMTEGQSMKGHNQFRKNFYEAIINKAEQLLTQQSPASSQETTPDAPRVSTPSRSQFSPYKAFEDLTEIIPLPPEESKAQGKQKATPHHESGPLVVLTFDEAHTITQRQLATNDEWTIFNELCYALRHLNRLPLFSLFLSTTGKISQFTSPTEEDLSKRVVLRELFLIQPYTDLGFDPLARRITVDGSQNLEELTGDSQTCSLGRPLFAVRHLKGSETVKQEIIPFAVAKLLNANKATDNLSNDQLLACLSQRFPIEFNSTNYISQEKERKQVEGHMRVCLKIDATLETMTTTSSSEPILSEAAYYVMQRQSFNAPRALQLVMDGFSISKGDRGEFLVLLLLILARDATVGPADELGQPIAGKRWFSLTDFLYGCTFRKQSGHSHLVDEKSISALGQLLTDFPNAQLHFSHFVKVHEHKTINIISLLLLQGRGAAVLCGNSQAGVDAINVFLKSGTRLARDNAGLILHQIKNDSRYSTRPQQALFDAMNPYELKILREGDPAVPLIKIVFALAAKAPSLHVVRHNQSEGYRNVIYEIWCAGISPDILGAIEQQQVDIWKSLLQASYGWQELYKTTSGEAADLRRSATPGAAADIGHYSCWAESPELQTLLSLE